MSMAGLRIRGFLPSVVILGGLYWLFEPESRAAVEDPRVRKVVSGGLDYLAYNQHKLGHWTADGRYPTAMTALAGMAFLSEGSTSTQGKYSENIRRAVDYILRQSRPNGLIGDPVRDDRYTYGHGFSMLFLSQVLGDEEDEDRRAELVDVLTRAVEFTGNAQTQAGGWGYVSAKDGGGFDEGSTTITQVQGLRGCRNAGIPVPKEVIDRAVQYIKDCTLPEGGVQYSSKGGGPRPAITAAAIACLFNAGQYDNDVVPRMMKYCEENLTADSRSSYGHWHYAHFYYSQVQYREGGERWERYRNEVQSKLVREAEEVKLGDKTGIKWKQGMVGPIYTAALNLVILQLDNACLPIYQR
ncbi:MAG: terpene cyclase/mutase family protein [Pirellulales bacterium]|nr:terpene cyclase/mutase family protein [Pirellulales bacterium]